MEDESRNFFATLSNELWLIADYHLEYCTTSWFPVCFLHSIWVQTFKASFAWVLAFASSFGIDQFRADWSHSNFLMCLSNSLHAVPPKSMTLYVSYFPAKKSELEGTEERARECSKIHFLVDDGWVVSLLPFIWHAFLRAGPNLNLFYGYCLKNRTPFLS